MKTKMLTLSALLVGLCFTAPIFAQDAANAAPADTAVPAVAPSPAPSVDVPATPTASNDATASAPTEPPQMEASEALVLVHKVWDAAKSGHYLVASAGALMLIIWLFQMFFRNLIKREQLPLWSAGVAVVFSVAMNLSLAPADVPMWKAALEAIGLGLVVGPAASGWWSLVGKKAFPVKKEEEKKNA